MPKYDNSVDTMSDLLYITDDKIGTIRRVVEVDSYYMFTDKKQWVHLSSPPTWKLEVEEELYNPDPEPTFDWFVEELQKI